MLTKNIQAQFNELQALIDRYLDDEAFTTYTEALDRKRAEKPRRPKAKARRRQGGRQIRTPTPAAARSSPAPQPAGSRGRQTSPAAARAEELHRTAAAAGRADASHSEAERPTALTRRQRPASAVFGSSRSGRRAASRGRRAWRASPRRGRGGRSAGVERWSIWLYQAVTIRVNSSIFSSCSRVYCSDGSPALASWTQCSSRAIVGSISRRFRSAMMTRNVSITSLSASNRSRRSPMMWTRRTTPQVISSRRLVETFDRLTSRSLLISSASSGLGRDEQQGVDLGHRPVDAPGLAHLAPVEHELLCGGSEFHGMFRPDWPNSFYQKLYSPADLDDKSRGGIGRRSSMRSPDFARGRSIRILPRLARRPPCSARPVLEVQRGRIDAIPQARSAPGRRRRRGRGGRRSRGRDLGAGHPEAAVALGLDVLSSSIGFQKLGQPVPESNLVSESKSGAPQQTHL